MRGGTAQGRSLRHAAAQDVHHNCAMPARSRTGALAAVGTERPSGAAADTTRGFLVNAQ